MRIPCGLLLQAQGHSLGGAPPPSLQGTPEDTGFRVHLRRAFLLDQDNTELRVCCRARECLKIRRRRRRRRSPPQLARRDKSGEEKKRAARRGKNRKEEVTVFQR